MKTFIKAENMILINRFYSFNRDSNPFGFLMGEGGVDNIFLIIIKKLKRQIG